MDAAYCAEEGVALPSWNANIGSGSLFALAEHFRPSAFGES